MIDDHPLLLYRTGSEKYPFVKPKGSQAYRTSKSVRGVYGTPLNAVWSTVGPLVRDLIKTQKIRYTSIDAARFITHETDKKDIPGPVVIWIGVHPGYTTADTAHDVSENILGAMESRASRSSGGSLSFGVRSVHHFCVLPSATTTPL